MQISSLNMHDTNSPGFIGFYRKITYEWSLGLLNSTETLHKNCKITFKTEIISQFIKSKSVSHLVLDNIKR